MTNRRNRKRKAVAVYFLTAAVGIASGWLRAAPEDPRFPASARREEAPRLTWDDLPCPSEEEYRRLAAIVKLEIPAGTDVCADAQHNKIARVLAYTEKLRISLPPDWAPLLHDDISNPLAFLGRMSKKMGIDLGQSTSIAYNRQGEIYLGGLFFQEDPLEAISVLVHEARHSAPDDPGHTTCRRGDIPRASGGCDYQLSTDPKKAGAYSYGAAFYSALGLYAEGISSSDREYLLGLALATISTRFNELPEELAQAFDLLAVLDEEGSVHLLHPYAREPVPLALPFLQEGEKVSRIEFNVKNNGLLFFTSKNRLFTWSQHATPGGAGGSDPAAGFQRVYATTIPESMPVYDAARVPVPFDDYPYYNFLTAENQIYFYRFSTSLKAYELAPYPIYRRNTVVPELSRLFMGLAGRPLFLGKDGLVYVGPRYGDELPFDPRADLQLPDRKWVHATGGVVYESLYGIADDGRVYFTKIELLPPEGDGVYDTEVFSVKESSLQPTGGRMGRKLAEGLSLRALLDNEGDLQIETYGREQRSFWRKLSGKVVDFTILRRHLVHKALIPTAERTAFASACGLKTTVPDPWFGVGMGLNQNGELVIGLPGGAAQPCLVSGTHKYKDLKFRAWSGTRTSRQREEHGASQYVGSPSYTRSLLWGTELNGQVTPLLPYNFR